MQCSPCRAPESWEALLATRETLKRVGRGSGGPLLELRLPPLPHFHFFSFPFARGSWEGHRANEEELPKPPWLPRAVATDAHVNNAFYLIQYISRQAISVANITKNQWALSHSESLKSSVCGILNSGCIGAVCGGQLPCGITRSLCDIPRATQE